MQAQEELFATVADDYFDIFEESGRPRAKKIADLLQYSRKDVSAATDLPLTKVRYEANKISKELIERVTEWGLALNMVAVFFRDEKKTVLWFQTKNPMLGDISPANMIRMGRSHKLMQFIRSALAEQSAG